MDTQRRKDSLQYFILFQVESINQIFVENLKDPPLYKNHPPVAGAIYWSRSLFYRIKHTIIRFQEVEELLASERGKEVCWFFWDLMKEEILSSYISSKDVKVL